MISGEEVKSNITKNILKYREKAGISQKELARQLNVSPSRVSNWEQGANCPNIDILFEVCKLLNVSINDIYGVYPNSELTLSYCEQDLIKKYRFILEHSPDGVKVVDTVLDRENAIAKQLKEQKEYIEKSKKDTSQNNISKPNTRLTNYYYRLASAGTGQIVFDMPPTEKIEIPAIPEYKKVDYAIGVNGNSMQPEYNDGDILLIEMTAEINLGEIGIFIVNGESYVKKLGDKELISLNPEYDNIPLTEDSKCMGKVVDKLWLNCFGILI